MAVGKSLAELDVGEIIVSVQRACRLDEAIVIEIGIADVSVPVAVIVELAAIACLVRGAIQEKSKRVGAPRSLAERSR